MVGASLFDTIVEIGNPTLFLVISYFRFPQMVWGENGATQNVDHLKSKKEGYWLRFPHPGNPHDSKKACGDGRWGQGVALLF